MMIDLLLHMKMYVDVMNAVVKIVNDDFHLYLFLFDLIEMMERFVPLVYSMLYHMNDVEHDVEMIND
jgi:hypothetical protein